MPVQWPRSAVRRVRGRFDDVVGGTALSFSTPQRVLAAGRPEDVVPLLLEVDHATRRGAWAFGFVTYEAAPGLDPRMVVASTSRTDQLPLALFGLCAQPAFVSPVKVPGGSGRAYHVSLWKRDWTEARYRDDVGRVRQHIAHGDTYQVNLTVRLHASITGDLPQLYTDLVWAQRGSHAAYIDLGRHVIASASPELFFEWTEDRLLTRPMKGTARRGLSTSEDADQLLQLLSSEKERSENVMIVDLLRNDLGKVAEVGSVWVPVLFAAERYETVWQLTSDVTARPRPGTGLADVFRALFPSGSVTGAPKLRTMELICELEQQPRGVYCGAIGVVAPPGHPYRARFNVAIRTLTIDRHTGMATYGTGGGITWSSNPASEHAELLAKAAILAEPYEEFELFETMAHVPPVGIRNLHRHLMRLADSARYFGFPYDEARTREQLHRSVPQSQPARVRLTLGLDGVLDVTIGPMPEAEGRPVRLALDPQPIDSRQVWFRHKTTRRGPYESRARRHPEVDDIVLVNDSGRVTETTIANIAARLDGRWWTPPVEAGCLPGVERGRLLEDGRLRERDLSPDDLRTAQGLAVVSSLRGWRPAILA